MIVIGIDLAVKGAHQALVADGRGQVHGPVIRFRTEPQALADLLTRARRLGDEGEEIRVVMEPTGLSWLPVACYLQQRGAHPHVVNAQRVADLHKYYHKHAKSDRLSADVLARLPFADPEALHPWSAPEADYLHGQRWCRQREHLMQEISAIRNRVQAWERAFWPGLEELVGDLFAPWVCQWRERWYDPWQLLATPPDELRAFLIAERVDPSQVSGLVTGLRKVAQGVATLYGSLTGGPSAVADYAALQDQMLREIRQMRFWQGEERELAAKIRHLYRHVHPDRRLETIRGVGEEGAAVYCFFTADVQRFGSQGQFRSWSGMIPGSNQSGEGEGKGLKITQAGPSLVRKYAYIDAEVARQWDPQLAALYYEQMMHRGKHHIQAVCCCATHLLDRVRAVLRDGKPYELRDVDGRPVTWQEARQIVQERYHVPEEVRQRTRRRGRTTRREQRAERQLQQEGSRLRGLEADAETSPHTQTASAPQSSPWDALTQIARRTPR